MEEKELNRLLERYRRGECTPEEALIVEGWYDALGNDREDVALRPGEKDTLKAELWQGIRARMEAIEEAAEPQLGVPTRRMGWVRWAAAAVVVIGVGAAGWMFQLQRSEQAQLAYQKETREAQDWITQRNSTDQIMVLALQDGSTVRLAPASSLKYRRVASGPERQVHLDGEAFFRIAHNPKRPFRVYTQKIVTTVLGTSFTVRAFEGKPAEVVVRTGKVRVTERSGAQAGDSVSKPTVVLTPNQQIRLSEETPMLRKELVAEPELLTVQPFRFDDRPVAEVLASLEKAYGITIHYDEQALATCSVNLTMNDVSLHKRLEVLCKTLEASYEVSGTDVVIHAKGCPAELAN